MKKQVYITEEERVKCQKVVDAFAELYELERKALYHAGLFLFDKRQNELSTVE